MEPQQLQAAEDAVAHEMEWKCSKLQVELTDPSGQLVEVNLTSHIQPPPRNGKGHGRYSISHIAQDSFTIPESLFENLNKTRKETPKKKVVALLETACRKSGFSLVAGRQYSSHNGQLIHHTLHCSRFQYKKSSKVKGESRQRTTLSSRPLPSETKCPFKFEVLQIANSNKWFFSSTISGYTQHCGHIQLPPDYVKVSRKSVPPHKHLNPSLISFPFTFSHPR